MPRQGIKRKGHELNGHIQFLGEPLCHVDIKTHQLAHDIGVREGKTVRVIAYPDHTAFLDPIQAGLAWLQGDRIWPGLDNR